MCHVLYNLSISHSFNNVQQPIIVFFIWSKNGKQMHKNK